MDAERAGSTGPRRRAIAALAFAIAVGIAGCTGAPGGTGAPSDAWYDMAGGGEPRENAAIDHSQWGLFLNAYRVEGQDGVARVAYGRIGETGRVWLDRYIASLVQLPISRYRRDEQLAYWINLYNALVVKLVAEHYPVGSIQDIHVARMPMAGPWTRPLVMIEGRSVSLDDILNRVLRPLWNDPRIHYLLACGAVGCPNLPAWPVTSENLPRLLEQAARDFINDPRGARIDDGDLRLSSLFKWYARDFGGSDWDVLAHVRRYAGRALAVGLRPISDIDGYDFDWALNDTP